MKKALFILTLETLLLTSMYSCKAQEAITQDEDKSQQTENVKSDSTGIQNSMIEWYTPDSVSAENSDYNVYIQQTISTDLSRKDKAYITGGKAPIIKSLVDKLPGLIEFNDGYRPDLSGMLDGVYKNVELVSLTLNDYGSEGKIVTYSYIGMDGKLKQSEYCLNSKENIFTFDDFNKEVKEMKNNN